MTDIRHSSITTAMTVAPRMLLRRTFHPYGKQGHSFSVTLRDDRTTGTTYLLTMRPPGAKLPIPLFEGKVIIGPDLDETAVEVLDTLTVSPGDGADLTEYTPEQLDFAIQHARTLRACVHERLSWNAGKRAPRVDLGTAYQKRAVGETKHRLTLGVVDVSARTRKDASAAFLDAIRNHMSSLPAFAKNGNGSIYALFPRGAEWVIQVINPQLAEWLGPVHTFAARTVEEAETELARVVNAVTAGPAPAKHRASGRLKSTGPTIGVRA